MNRRDFLRKGLAGASAVAPLFQAAAGAPPLLLVADPADPVVSAGPVRWALTELTRALSDAGVAVHQVERLGSSEPRARVILAAGHRTPTAAAALARAGVSLGEGPERLALLTTRLSGREALIVCGTDARGLTYALLEIADRLRSGASPIDALTQTAPTAERPANAVRSIMRQFTSQALDSPWFADREMWPAYLTMLATHRFNRFHLGFGLGYDTLQRVDDSYLLFLYPFLVDVPGYRVRVTNLADAERDRNLGRLRDISEQAAARGLTFQLGVWMHGYQLINSPQARYVVEGLTPETHAAYCRDALTAVLVACPAISAVALRIHGESGIAEGSYDFWQTVFDGVPRAGRRIEIDLHAKGLDQQMIDRALATGMPVNVSPKYWAEHLGMPYHQAAIRELEMPVAGRIGAGLMTMSEGNRSVTRYGYADFLREDRRYTVRHRVFNGTQRLLLSGDAAAAAAYSRMFQFCGSNGVDMMEPLTCRGRRGTGAAGGRRSGYADGRLDPRWDWEKFAYWYRVNGRLTYNPDAGSAQWRRHFRRDTNAGALEAALSQASRILPIVTTAHLPSAACDAYWPEVYWNQPIVDEPRPNPYGDTPAPKTFQHVSPLDPQLFSGISEHAAEVMQGIRGAKYSPIEVAQWLDTLAAAVTSRLATLARVTTPDAQRLTIDAAIQAGLGRFFADKLRAGVLYAIHEASNDRAALEQALARYRAARQAWASVVERARGVYAGDLSVSDKLSARGQWSDRLAGIDEDIDRMAQRLVSIAGGRVATAPDLSHALSSPLRPVLECRHTAARGFRPGADLPLELSIARDHAIRAVHCHYRHVNQAERFVAVEMAPSGGVYRGTIPAAYTDSPYPLLYYFVVTTRAADAVMYPGFGASLLGQPYFVLRRL